MSSLISFVSKLLFSVGSTQYTSVTIVITRRPFTRAPLEEEEEEAGEAEETESDELNDLPTVK